MEMQSVRMTEAVSVVVDWTDAAPFRTTVRADEVVTVPQVWADAWVDNQQAVPVSDDEARFSPSFRSFE